jgi:dolichyl-phosphate beta-glucosyltransferase
MMKSACLIPFYNEEQRIDYSKFEAAFAHTDILFYLINDGSKDKTIDILNSFATKHANVIVINNKVNVGKAEGIRLAMLEVVKIEEIDFIGFFDCDFATPFSEYLRLNQLIKEKSLQLIFGSRIKLYGKHIERNGIRHYLSRIFITVSNTLFSLEIYDTQCGCKIFQRDIIQTCFSHKFLSKWLFDIEIFIRLLHNNKSASIMEEGLYEWKEIGGSKIKMTDFLKFPFQLINLFYRYRIRKYGLTK